MDKEKMLYHANAKGTLNFDVRSMKKETKNNLQFLLDGGYLIRDPDSLFAGSTETIWQDFCITGDGKILLAIYRLEYVYTNHRDTEKYYNRVNELQFELDNNHRNVSYFEPSLTKNQKKAVAYMLSNSTSTNSNAKDYVQKLKDLKNDNNKVESSETSSQNKLDRIHLDELSLVSMFNMSVGLGQRDTDRTRHEDYVMKKCAEELGELSLEINISQGLSYKEPGKDGIKGEAVDLAICALDMFALQCDNMTSEEIEREFLSYMLTKLHKWKSTLE